MARSDRSATVIDGDGPGGAETFLPVAAIQRQIVAHEATIDTASAYSLLAGARLHGPVDAGRLDAALSLLVDAHPALRARMTIGGDGLSQAIAPPGRGRGRLEVRAVGAGESLSWARDFARTPLDIFMGPPFQAALFVEKAPAGSLQRSLLALKLHHAFGDGHSLATLCRQSGECYADPDRPPFATVGSPSDRQGLDAYRGQVTIADEAADEQAAIRMSDPPPFRTGRGAIQVQSFGRARTNLVRERARAARITPFSTALAAFVVALQGRFDCPGAELSVPVMTRTEPSAMTVVGPLIRTARVRIQPTRSRVASLLHEVHDSVIRATFGTPEPDDDDEAWTLKQGLSFSADVEPAQYLRLRGVEVEPVVLHPDTAVFGLTGTLETIRGGEYRLRIEAATETMTAAEARDFLTHVMAVLDVLLEADLEQELPL